MNAFEQVVHAAVDAVARPSQQARHDADVFGDRHVREEPDRLNRIADAAAKRDRVHRPHVNAVDQDRAAGRLDEPVHRSQQRRLPAARRTDDRDDFAGRDVERDAAQGVAVGVGIANADVVEADRRSAQARAALRKAEAASAGDWPPSTAAFMRCAASVVICGETASRVLAMPAFFASAPARTTGAT